MGMIKIEMYGSFPKDSFQTCAEEGGHAAAINRAIIFLTRKLGDAIAQDVKLAKEGVAPPTAPFGMDKS